MQESVPFSATTGNEAGDSSVHPQSVSQHGYTPILEDNFREQPPVLSFLQSTSIAIFFGPLAIAFFLWMKREERHTTFSQRIALYRGAAVGTFIWTVVAIILIIALARGHIGPVSATR
eukprot:GFKZ01014775.1.p1 GENE.GFKZ01014775.1~~GFKZ01014775.1.p1  ORF type:complete len:118 (-),score=6.32 GFKZ01014775.1:277-630(-)